MRFEIDCAINSAGGADFVETAAFHRRLLWSPHSLGGKYVFAADLVREQLGPVAALPLSHGA